MVDHPFAEHLALSGIGGEHLRCGVDAEHALLTEEVGHVGRLCLRQHRVETLGGGGHHHQRIRALRHGGLDVVELLVHVVVGADDVDLDAVFAPGILGELLLLDQERVAQPFDGERDRERFACRLGSGIGVGVLVRVLRGNPVEIGGGLLLDLPDLIAVLRATTVVDDDVGRRGRRGCFGVVVDARAARREGECGDGAEHGGHQGVRFHR